MMDFSSSNLSLSNCWILVWAKFIFFYKWVEANTFNMQFIAPIFGWDDHKETIPATLGCRNMKLSKRRQPAWITHLFICSQRSYNKYSFHYYYKKQFKNHQSKKYWLLSRYFVPKWMQQVVLVLWWACGLQQSPPACWNARKATAEWYSAYKIYILFWLQQERVGARGQLIIFIWWHVRQGPNPGFTH